MMLKLVLENPAVLATADAADSFLCGMYSMLSSICSKLSYLSVYCWLQIQPQLPQSLQAHHHSSGRQAEIGLNWKFVTPASSITSDHRPSPPCLINDHHHHSSLHCQKVQNSASIITLNSEDDVMMDAHPACFFASFFPQVYLLFG